MTTRSPWPSEKPSDGAAAARAEHQRPRRADRQDRDHGVLVLRPADAVAVPGDRVAAVAVEAQPGRDERLTQLGGVVPAQRVARLVQHRVGERLALAVELQQPRDVDHALVHLPALGVPRHRAVQQVEQLVGAREPAGPVVDPGAPGQRRALQSGRELAQREVVGGVEERALECHAHATQHTSHSNMCPISLRVDMARSMWVQRQGPRALLGRWVRLAGDDHGVGGGHTGEFAVVLHDDRECQCAHSVLVLPTVTGNR